MSTLRKPLLPAPPHSPSLVADQLSHLRDRVSSRSPHQTPRGKHPLDLGRSLLKTSPHPETQLLICGTSSPQLARNRQLPSGSPSPHCQPCPSAAPHVAGPRTPLQAAGPPPGSSRVTSRAVLPHGRWHSALPALPALCCHQSRADSESCAPGGRSPGTPSPVAVEHSRWRGHVAGDLRVPLGPPTSWGCFRPFPSPPYPSFRKRSGLLLVRTHVPYSPTAFELSTS